MHLSSRKMIETPYLTSGAINWLNSFLKPHMHAFEWGSGGSTIFIASRVKLSFSVEHDKNWYKKILQTLLEKEYFNCHYLLLENLANTYITYIDYFPDNFFDFILVDGRNRNICIAHALNKVKQGGRLMLDNSDRENYAPGRKLLQDWQRRDFRGCGIEKYKGETWQATVWKKIY